MPLLSWLILRGRCQRCDAAIDPRHPIIELAAAALAVLMVSLLPWPAAVAGTGLAWVLLLLTALDLDRHWLPDRLTLPLLGGGIVVGLAGIGPAFADHVLGAAFGWAVLEAVRRSYRKVRGRAGLGGGDPKLFAAIGAWVGWATLPLVLLIASGAGLLLVLGARLMGRRIDGTTRLPFGPFLAVGGIIGWILLAR